MSATLSEKGISSDPSLSTSYQFLHVHVLVWGVLSIICMVVLVLMRYFQPFLRWIVCEGEGTVYMVWMNVGNFILLVRGLILATRITQVITGEFGKCHVVGRSVSGYYDNTFQVNLMLVCLDAVQTLVFSTLSFPLPWAAIFCLIELISQFFRFYSCMGILFGGEGSITYTAVCVWLALIAMYSIVGLNTSVILLSSRNFYQNTLHLASSTAEKRRFVDLLCTEIRSPLQHVVGAVSRITDTVLPQSSKDNILEIGHLVTRQTQLINLLSDNLLYLTRVEEGRAFLQRDTSHLNKRRINVKDLTMKLSCQHSVMDSDGLTFCELVQKISLLDAKSCSSIAILGDLTLLTILVRNMLYFGLIMLDDKRDTETLMSSCVRTGVASGVPLSQPLRRHSVNSDSSDFNSSVGDHADEQPPLVLTISVVENGLENKRGKARSQNQAGSLWSSRLHLSLSCPVLDELAATAEAMRAKRSDECEGEDGKAADGERESPDDPAWGRLSAVANKNDYSTILMTCSALTGKAGGSFSISRSKVEFSIACGGIDTPIVATSGHGSGGGGSGSGGGGPITNTRPRSGSLSMNIAVDIKTVRVCIIAERSELVSSIPGLLAMVGIDGRNVSMMSEFKSSDQDAVNELSRVYDVCFVGSIFESVRIKERGYPGRVVLFSGSVAYMDDETISKCDFILGVPCMKTDADHLKAWITSPNQKTTIASRKELSSAGAGGEGDEAGEGAMLLDLDGEESMTSDGDDAPTSGQGQRSDEDDDDHTSPALMRVAATVIGDGVYWLIRQFIKSISDVDHSVKTYSLGTKFNYVDTSVLFVSMFQNDVEKTFCKWRLLNPGGFRLIHVFATDCSNVMTTLTFLAGVAGYTMLIAEPAGIQQTYENCRESYCYNSPWTYSVPAFCAVVLLREIIHKRVLGPLGISLYAYWFVGSILVILAFNTHLLDFYFAHDPDTWLWSPGYWKKNLPPPVKISFAQFCSAKFGMTVGLEVLHVLLSSFSIICAGWMFHIMWPISIISTLIAVTRSYIIINVIIDYVIVDVVVGDLVVATFILFAITIIIGQFYLEISLRNEFQSFRKTTFSHLFLELSLDAVQKNLRKPLENILLAKERYLCIVQDIAVSQRIAFTPSLLGEFDTLNMGHLLLRELYYELDFKDCLAQIEQASAAPWLDSKGYRHHTERKHALEAAVSSLYKNSNDPFLLTEELLKIADSFSCFRSDFAVKVYVSVDPRLALVRTNVKLFTSVIVNALAKAHKSIWARLRGNDYLRSYVQEISIVVKPVVDSRPSRFFDTRLMVVEVSESNGFLVSVLGFDASLTPSKGAAVGAERGSDTNESESEGFGSQMCREVVLNAAPDAVFETSTLKCGNAFYYSCQRFTVPYQLHTCSGTAESFRRLKRSLGALYTERPIAAYVNAYEHFHRQMSLRRTNEDRAGKRRSFAKFLVLIVEVDDFTARNKGLKDLFKKNSWTVKTISSMGEWDEKYLQCDCVLIDMNSVPLMQSRDGLGPSGSASDLDVVTLLRVLGYKMVIAQIECKKFFLEESDLSKPAESHPADFDFNFSDSNFSRTGLRQLEDACNTRAIGHLCWLHNSGVTMSVTGKVQSLA